MPESYIATVAVRALRKTMKDVVGESWTARLIHAGALVLTLGFAYAWLVYVDENSTIYSDTQIAAMFALGVGASLFVFGFTSNFLWIIPAAIWKEGEAKIADMTDRLAPRFSVAVAVSMTPENVDYGQTSVSWGGTLQTIIRAQNNIFKIDIENRGDVSLVACEAYLARFSDAELGEPSHWQSLRLPWLETNGQHDSVTIPAKGKRSISLFKVVNNRTIFLTTEMAANVVHAIKDKGKYQGLIVLTAVGSAASYVRFSLECDAPEAAPILTLTRDTSQ